MSFEIAVVPFGDRWAIERLTRRVSIHATFEGALAGAVEIAGGLAIGGKDMPILVKDRGGAWREEWYSADPDFFGAPIGLKAHRRQA